MARVLAWHQAITWTNADPVHLRIYTALGGDEFMILLLKPFIDFQYLQTEDSNCIDFIALDNKKITWGQ